jgi:hypothetical protein
VVLFKRWKDNIKTDLREIALERVNWIHPLQDRDRWRALVNTVMNLRVHKMRGISWLAERPVSFSRRALLYGVCLELDSEFSPTFFELFKEHKRFQIIFLLYKLLLYSRTGRVFWICASTAGWLNWNVQLVEHTVSTAVKIYGSKPRNNCPEVKRKYSFSFGIDLLL